MSLLSIRVAVLCSVATLSQLSHANGRFSERSQDTSPVSSAVYIDTYLYAFSEPVPNQQMIDGWDESGVGEYAQAKARLSLGAIVHPNWSVGVQKRWDYHFLFTRDTARFYSLLENQDLTVGTYPLDLSVNGLESRALFLQYFIPLSSSVDVTITPYVIKPDRVQWGRLKGEGEVLPNGQYSFEYDLDYQYSRDALLERNAKNVEGWGHALDVALDVQVSEQVSAHIWMKDAFYSIYWQALDRSEGCLFRSRSQLEVCDQNFVRDSVDSGVQTLPMEAGLKVKWAVLPRLHLDTAYWEWGKDSTWEVGVNWRVMRLYSDFLHDSVGIGYQSDRVQFSIGLDDTSIDNARYWQWALGLTWPLQ